MATLFQRIGQALGFVPNTFPYVQLHTLEWKEVQKWMNGPGNPENVGRGYVGQRLQSSDGWTISLRRALKNGYWYTTADLLHVRSSGPVASQTWISKKYSLDLERRFGKSDAFKFKR